MFCFSASSIHSAAADGVIPQSSENNSISASFSATAASSELHPVESSDVKVGRISAASVFMCLGSLFFFFFEFVALFLFEGIGSFF
jgi:hypothetical protein